MSKAAQFETIDFNQMSFSQLRPTAGGKGVSICYARCSSRNNAKVQFQIGMPDPRLFDMSTPLFVRQQLLDELCAVRTKWHLKEEAADSQFSADGRKTLLLTLPKPEWIKSAKCLDQVNEAMVVSHPIFFKGKISDTSIRDNFVHLCQRYPFADEVSDEEKVDTLRIKVKDGDGDYDTKIRVQNPITGKFFKGTLADIEMFCRVVPVLENTGVFVRGNESGGMLFATALIVFPRYESRGIDALDIGMDLPMESDEDSVEVYDRPRSALAVDPTDQTVINFGNNAARKNEEVPASEPLF
jgi:hypothetical protein